MGAIQLPPDQVSHQVGQLPPSAGRGQRGVLNVVLDIERAVVDPVRVVEAERHRGQAPAERRQQVHARRHQLPNERRIQRAPRRGFGVEHPQDAHVTMGAAIFHGQELGIEACKLSHALMVVPGGHRPLVCLRQQWLPQLSNIRTFSTCSDSVQRMEPAWVGAQGESERHLWSTVVQKAAGELTERAREISDAVTIYQTEWLPDLLDNAETLEGIRASTEASIRDFAEVLRSGADPVKAVKLGSATVDYALDGAAVPVPLVLHGSSGVPDDDLRRAVQTGITKINVGTILNVVFTGAIRERLTDTGIVDPRKYLSPARRATADTVAAITTAVSAPSTGQSQD